MTQIIIAIALWCGGGERILSKEKVTDPVKEKPGYFYGYNYQETYTCAFDECRKNAFECMEKGKWSESKLPDCLGRNRPWKSEHQ